MTDTRTALRALHTQLVDAREGYAEGIELAEPPEIVTLFRELHDLHGEHAAGLERAMAAAGDPLDPDDTSIMATVHKAVLTIRSAVTGLDENVLPGIRSGEQHSLEAYDKAIAALPVGSALSTLLEAQRESLANRLALLDVGAVEVRG
jgi:uncharacterized protein (TIGR02284 family)